MLNRFKKYPKNAQCGRCGLWQHSNNKLPHQTAGTCLFYLIKLSNDELYIKRYCKHFIPKIQNLTTQKHLDIKMQREFIHLNFNQSKFAAIISLISILIAILSLITNIVY